MLTVPGTRASGSLSFKTASSCRGSSKFPRSRSSSGLARSPHSRSTSWRSCGRCVVRRLSRGGDHVIADSVCSSVGHPRTTDWHSVPVFFDFRYRVSALMLPLEHCILPGAEVQSPKFLFGHVLVPPVSGLPIIDVFSKINVCI